MNSKPDTGEVREARGKAVEIAALWKPWKTKKQFSTVPTSLGKLSAKKRASSFPQFPQLRQLLSFERKKLVRSAVVPRVTNATGSHAGGYGYPEAGWQTISINRRRLGESFFLTSPFIEQGIQGDIAMRRILGSPAWISHVNELAGLLSNSASNARWDIRPGSLDVAADRGW